ncbi:ABC transporter substrate-binding protein [Sphingobacterium corticis]|uniref:ABC transporter substrate-binding protein n=1 Tax=Sphingobacterium corticis TaxID=1812823 RepID=A0ABW5NI47_9SPHI
MAYRSNYWLENSKVWIGCFVLIVCMGCQYTSEHRKESSTIHAIDARGKSVGLDKYADRVVVLFEPFVDAMFMLQASDKLVGIPQQIYQNASTFRSLSQLDKRIAQRAIATPTFGGRSSHTETIVGLNADLAIVYEHDRETIEQLEGLGIPVFAVSSRDKSCIYKELIGVASLIDRKERAEEIVQRVETGVKAMQVNQHKVKKKVYYAWSKGRVFSTSGRGSLVDLSVEVSGAANACPLAMEAPNISAESIYKWNPDLIVLWNSDVEDVYSLQELKSLPAVVNKQVFVMQPTFYFDPHTVKFLLFAKQLKHWCYPNYGKEAFQRDLQEMLQFLYGENMKLE